MFCTHCCLYVHLACIRFVHVIVPIFFGYILDVNAVVMLLKKVCIACAGDRRVQAGERQQVADVFGSARFTKGQSAESIRAVTVIALVGL
jgi:hypothetical protein